MRRHGQVPADSRDYYLQATAASKRRRRLKLRLLAVLGLLLSF